LKLFEVFVQAIKSDTSTLNEPDQELKAIFDFILSQDFKEQTSAGGEDISSTVKVSIDMLTILFVHIVISKNIY